MTLAEQLELLTALTKQLADIENSYKEATDKIRKLGGIAVGKQVLEDLLDGYKDFDKMLSDRKDTLDKEIKDVIVAYERRRWKEREILTDALIELSGGIDEAVSAIGGSSFFGRAYTDIKEPEEIDVTDALVKHIAGDYFGNLVDKDFDDFSKYVENKKSK